MRDMLPTLGMLAGWLGRVVKHWFRRLLLVSGFGAFLLAALAFTRIPFDVHRWLGLAAGECTGQVDVIVVLGGSGMPSGPELLRLHRAAELAKENPHASVLVVHPDTADAMLQMIQELGLRGVSRDRMLLITQGDNTRAQALEVTKSMVDRTARMALVTAPENMYRSVLAFRRVGVRDVCGSPAWDHAMNHDFNYAHKTIGGKAWAPDVSDNPGLRYTFWNYLKLEITCLREFAAIVYYWLNDWI